MSLPVPIAVLDRLMPLHVILDADWRVIHAGPTLHKLAGGLDLAGRAVCDVFQVEGQRPRALHNLVNRALSIRLVHGMQPRLRGILLALGDAAGGAHILNLSPYITEWKRLGAAELSLTDFAPTDMVAERLYLIEANSLAMAEANSLIARLQGAAVTAEKMAVTDTLTGLHNRRALEQAMHRLIDRAVPFALMRLDLDRFKAVNDTHGHAAGDAVLQHVARVLREITRATDTVARIGGDEFVVLLNRLTSPPTIHRIARRIIAQVERPVPFDGRECRVSTSLGTTLSTHYDRPEADRMLADADKALYTSKGGGSGDPQVLVAGQRRRPAEG